nr:type IV secretion system protein [uncultured Halomonas sp.]
MFNLAGMIANQFDTVITDYVATTSSAVITFITPIIGILLTISLMIRGVLSMASDGPPFLDLLKSYFFMAVIVAVASAGGVYQASISQFLLSFPDLFANAIMGATGVPSSGVANQVDMAMDQGIEATKKVWDSMGWNPVTNIVAAIVGLFIIVATLLMCGISFAFILVSKFMLGIMVAFGPLFILLLPLPSAKQITDKWIAALVTNGTVVVLLASIFGLLMTMFTHVLSSLSVDSNLYAKAVSVMYMTIVALFVLFEVRSVSQSIGSGASVAIMSSVNSLRGTQNGAGAFVGGSGAGASSGASSGGSAGAGATGGRAANDAVGAAKKAAGAFKGSGR